MQRGSHNSYESLVCAEVDRSASLHYLDSNLMGYKPLYFTDARTYTLVCKVCLLLRWNIYRNEPVCLCGTSSSCEEGITMKLCPVMKSEATPNFLKLRRVYDRPSFLYALTSLMSSFFVCVCLERVTCPFSLGLNKRCSFCTSQLANLSVMRKVGEERLVQRWGENKQGLTFYQQDFVNAMKYIESPGRYV